ncbi:HigA family addiction module antidote protein [Bradyrhizobium sp. 83012]|uniref:HigA family addiction module antidote protein n=1 Tax=Bradyrhizobium aeschynomenes TaxID=2734909 RepID=A0ABX2C7W7_9BRAD|nr:HigA family addiction module antitoxin [Bradyrhizobium aeschynomenes]NPU63402.1 HigA family addiction module antidote protein [Bradyrhizobium aeschynomenes]
MTELKAGPRRRKPSHPGAILESNIAALGLTVYAAAKALGVTQMALHNIIGGKTGISARMALRLGKWLSNGPEIWMNLQAEYDLWEAREAIKAELAAIAPAATAAE